MLVLCPTCGKPVVEYNPNCKKHTTRKVHKPKRAHKRRGPKVDKRDPPAPLYVKAILHFTVGIHPSVLAAAVQEVTQVNFQKIIYCTNPCMYEAGELFVALTYFGLGLTQDEIAECHTTVQAGCNFACVHSFQNFLKHLLQQNFERLPSI
jgi:hypothetical protein